MNVSHAMLHRAEIEESRKNDECNAYSATHDKNYELLITS